MAALGAGAASASDAQNKDKDKKEEKWTIKRLPHQVWIQVLNVV
jgi:hypothetical protein